MLLSGVGTLETDVTKPLSATEKITLEMHRVQVAEERKMCLKSASLT